MTTFSFSTGNPSNLTGGATASMTDISGSLTDLKTFLNGASIDATNLATSAKPLTLLGQYQTLSEAVFAIGDTTTAGLYQCSPNYPVSPLANGAAQFPQSGSPMPLGIVAADHTVSGATCKLRIRAEVGVNTNAPGITFTFGLHPVTSVAGGSDIISYTVNTTAVSGSTVALASPTQGGSYATGSDFDVPSGVAGSLWILCVLTSNTPNANSITMGRVVLQKHYI